jgi:DNA ligase-1
MLYKQNINKDNMTISFPTLYGKDKSGTIREWTIYVENKGQVSDIVMKHGVIDGQLIVTKRVIEKGKNIGKKNETTHYEQALSEAQSKWNKKKDKEGYVEDSGILNRECEKTVLFPMLAQDYTKHKHKIQFPCYVQPKLDGYRAIYKDGEMWSRQGNAFEIVRHQFEHLKDIPYILDGELYSSTLKFEELGVLRKTASKMNSNDKEMLRKIDYYVYDIADTNLVFEERLKILKSLKGKYPKLVVVNTNLCERDKDVSNHHAKAIEDGYEGIMLRNVKGSYREKHRSYDLQKYKLFKDEEFEIIGFDKEQGDLIVWVCKTQDERVFNVQSKGTKSERKDLYKRATGFIGKRLWVQFFEYTADGVPRFPKTMRSGEESIRNVEL